MDKTLQNIGNSGLAIVAAIIGLATIAVIVGSRNTAPLVQASGSTLASVIRAAVNPVATAATNGNPNVNAYGMPSVLGSLFNGNS